MSYRACRYMSCRVIPRLVDRRGIVFGQLLHWR